jgi:ribosomal protein L40E
MQGMNTHANLTVCPKCGGLKGRRAKTCGKCAGKGYKGHGPTAVECTCEYCQKSFFISKWRKEQGRGRFCSKECKDRFLTTITGEKHPKYTGRYAPVRYLGADWKKARQAVIDRAGGKCEQCGIDLSKVKRYAVHHIIGAHNFDPVGKAHFADNLSVICQSCHAKNHNLGKMPE